jgi:transglutaminase-like putative cysteine protease
VTARLRIVHTTRYLYGGKVLSSYNEARLTPQTTADQLTLESTVQIDPVATVQRYWDYWGTQVTAFDLHTPHDRLEVVARSTVETGPAHPPAEVFEWDLLRSDAVLDDYSELLAPTSYAPREPRLADVAAEVAAQPDPLAAVHAAADAVSGHLTYVSGATGVHTTAVQAWEAGAGVCQDFAHLALTLLRAAGIPARYVSGYLYPRKDAAPGSTVVGESHAWVQAWVGDWVSIDPTNRSEVGERHVLVATGRDYSDVSPLRGLYSGAGRSKLEVTVEMTRLR